MAIKCACKGSDKWDCWAVRYSLPRHISDFRHEVENDGGPCECSCHDADDDPVLGMEAALRKAGIPV